MLDEKNGSHSTMKQFFCNIVYYPETVRKVLKNRWATTELKHMKVIIKDEIDDSQIKLLMT